MTRTLNIQQQEALQAALGGKNLFITGPGGTGKSYLIHTLVEELSEKGNRVAVTALTGCAALLLGHKAKTLHSWAGIGLGKDSATQICASIKKYNPKALRRWLMTHTLIIDEVSMLTPELLDKLNDIAMALRKNGRPFGGMQVIFVGDFYQLPPVYKRDDNEEAPIQEFAFESKTWASMALQNIKLTEIIRQQDPIFHKVLQEARNGKLSDDSLQILKTRQDADWTKEKIRPTLLFSRRAEVEMINEQNLKALKGIKHTFEAKTVFDATLECGKSKESPEVQRAIAKLDRDAPYKVSLDLRVGAQVMLVYNLDQEAGLVNGSRGIVEGFTATTPPVPLVLFRGTSSAIPIGEQSWESEDIEGLNRSQIPLILAYAVTIHKSQGATLDSALIDIGSSTFEKGQAYVALSRVKSLDSLYVYELDPLAFKTHPKVIAFYQSL